MNLLLDLKNELVNYFRKIDSKFSLKEYVDPLPPAPSSYKETDEQKQKRQLRHETTALLERYINFSRRRLEFQGSKKVFESQEICQKLNNGTLPKEICSAIVKIKSELENGDDVHTRLSRLIEQLNFDDKLLDDWNIYHFHLSDIDDVKSGFKKRTGELLFVYAPLHSDSMYFLDVSANHTGITFCCMDLLDLINRNWPDLLKDFKVTPASNPEWMVKTDDEYLKLRKCNVNPVIHLPSTDEFIMAPGLGLTSKGTSIENQDNAIGIIKTINKSEKNFSENLAIKLSLKDNFIVIKNILTNEIVDEICIL